jgi:hypothetical protein
VDHISFWRRLVVWRLPATKHGFSSVQNKPAPEVPGQFPVLGIPKTVL